MAGQARSEEEVTACLMALVAWAGNAHEASRYLKREKGITISHQGLTKWKTTHGARYDELREKHSGEIEARVINEYRELTLLATAVAREAVETTRSRLKEGKEGDPARAAANMATVAQKSTDKMLSLSGRPTQITETRNLEEILRSLAAKGIVQVPDEPAQIAEEAG